MTNTQRFERVLRSWRTGIARKGIAHIVLSTGASQFDTIKALTESDIDWHKVEMFHLYVF